MDRQIIYAEAIPLDTDFLNQNRNVMVGLGMLMQAILGPNTWIDGLACTPTSPASMAVRIGPGSIYTQQNVDNSAYGSLAADTADQIVKQGLTFGQTQFNCPAPSTSGFSVAYLIQATYADVDSGDTVLPYFNPDDIEHPFSGPDDNGLSQKTVRQGVCQLTLKAGTPATTGSQALPAADVGAMPVAAITVANGQVTITSGNIFQLGNYIPRLTALLSTIQSGSPFYAADSSGAANTITVSLTPSVSALVAGQPLIVKVANANTGAVVINTNGLGNVAANLENGNAIPAGMLQANGIYLFVYDGNHWQLQEPMAGAFALGHCKFNYTSATQCTLLPEGGNKVVFPSGRISVIPSAGLTTTNTSASINGTGAQTLANSTLYYAYLWNNNGTDTIDWSTTAYAVDATTGIKIKSGDATRVLVGMAETNSSGQFVQTAASRQVRSWFNERTITTSGNFSTTRSTTSSAPTEINTEIRNNILLWTGETVTANISGVASNSTSADGVGTGVGVDSTTTISGGASGGNSEVGTHGVNTACQFTTNSLSEGLHFFTLLGFISSGGTGELRPAANSCNASRIGKESTCQTKR